MTAGNCEISSKKSRAASLRAMVNIQDENKSNLNPREPITGVRVATLGQDERYRGFEQVNKIAATEGMLLGVVDQNLAQHFHAFLPNLSTHEQSA